MAPNSAKIGDNLTVLSLNCRSIYSKKLEIKLLVYNKRPHIICLSETWAVPDKLPTFVNYNIFWKHRTSGSRGGGLATLVRSDLIAIEKTLNYLSSPLEVHAITVKTQNLYVDILNLYNPNVNISKNTFLHYFNQLSRNSIVIGDFNAHHTTWSKPNTQNNPTGTALSQSLLETNLCLATPPGLTTYVSASSGSQSTLDLHLLSPNLLPSSEIVVCPCVGSDHYPLELTLRIKPLLQTIKFLPKWKLDNVRWDLWAAGLPPLQWDIESAADLDAANEKLVSCLTKSSYKIKQTSGEYNPRFNKPWWNEECERLVEIRKRAKKIVCRNATAATIANLRAAENKVKIAVDLAKERSTKEFIGTINSSTTSKTIWDKVNSIRGKFEPKKVVLDHNHQILTDPLQKANKIADHFETIFNRNYPSQQQHNTMYMNIQNSIILGNNDDYNKDFTLNELQQALSKLKNSTPGKDRIHNLFLKNAPLFIQEYLLNLFNSSWLKENIPNKWLKAILIPICKPNKEPSQVKSYRPISLLSCISKLMERMVASRLEWILEAHNLMSYTQCGFRKQRSTIDQLTLIDNDIRTSLQNNGVCIAAFIDLTGAFDRVWNVAVLQKMINMGFRGRILGWLYSYLNGRSFEVFLEGEYSSSRQITSGVPQGGVLSPLLFNILISDIPNVEGVQYSEFADDIAIYCSGNDYELVVSKIERALDEINSWVLKWGQEINTDKSKCMYFTKKHHPPRNVKLRDQPIEYVREFKFLGLTLDSPRLTYRNHILSLQGSCSKSISVMKFMSHYKWGSSRETLLMLYRSLIRSKLDYACHLYHSSSLNNLKILDNIQNQCLRLAIGAWETTPIISLEVESNVPPLKIRREFLILKNRLTIGERSHSSPLARIMNLRQLANNSFLKNSVEIASKWDLTFEEQEKIPQFHPLPPWENISKYIFESFRENSMALNDQNARIFYKDLVDSKYSGFLQIFTDGSKMENGVGAGVVLPEFSLEKRIKLPKTLSIMSAELVAIREALKIVSINTQFKKIVIFTDSLSSIMKLKSQNKLDDSKLHEIIQKLYELNQKQEVHIQWIPSHKGILGNELADKAAKNAILYPFLNQDTPNLKERVNEIKTKQPEVWQKMWENQINVTNKGRALYSVKNKIGHWPWAENKNRRLGISITRLRLGHAGLNQIKHRFGITHDPLCQCGELESIQHYLLECPNFETHRQSFRQKLMNLSQDLNFDLKTILGGSNLNEIKQNIIQKELGNYLYQTGKSSEL